MPFEVKHLSPHVGAEVAIDLETMLSGAATDELRTILLANGILLVRNITLDDDQLLTFAKTLGVVRAEKHDSVNKVEMSTADPFQAEYLRGTFSWHMDSTYEDSPPLGAVVTPRGLSPEGGETEFASACAAYEDLPDSEKRFLEGLQVVHSMESFMSPSTDNPSEAFRESWSKFPKRTLPLVRAHGSGRKALIISTSAEEVVGMDPAEGKALVRRLMEWVTQPRYVYRHEWRLGDVLVWDNTGTMHRVLPYPIDCGRRLSRVAIFATEYQGDGSEFADGKATLNRMRGGKAFSAAE